MIDFSGTLAEMKGRIAMACPDGMDARALIFAADNAMRSNVCAVSAPPESVNMLWTWLEKSGIKIFARCQVDGRGFDASKIAAQLHAAFKKGAVGVQLIAAPDTLNKLAAALSPVAADLFFGRDLVLMTDLDDVAPSDWDMLFHSLKRINAKGLGILAGAGENAAGAVYGMLDSFDSDFAGYLQVISKDSDMLAVENIWRLIQKMRPETANKTSFFLEHKQ